MPKSNSPLRVAATLAVGLLLLAAASCGRKADPDVAGTGATAPQSVRPVGIPVGPSAAPQTPERKPTGSFVLDPLL